MTNPIAPWMGCWRRLAKRLLALFPDHDCYIKVLAGGAACTSSWTSLFRRRFLCSMPTQTHGNTRRSHLVATPHCVI